MGRGKLTMLRDTLGDADSQGNLSEESFLDTSGSQRGAAKQLEKRSSVATMELGSGLRNEDGSGTGAGLLYTLRDVLEDGKVKMSLASLFGVGTTNNLGACVFIVSINYTRYVRARLGRHESSLFVPYSMACWAWKLCAIWCQQLSATPCPEAIKNCHPAFKIQSRTFPACQ